MRKTMALLALAPLLLAGCGTNSEQSSDRMEMRAYEVPPETTHDVQRALIDSFTVGSNKYIGNVGVVAPGKLVVTAPASLQDSIGTSLGKVAKVSSGTDKPLQLNVHFWSVDAVPGPGADTSPAELKDALAQARATLGDIHFSLQDQMGGVAGTGQMVEQRWQTPGKDIATNSLRYTISGSADSLSMMFRYDQDRPGHPSSGLSTTLPLKLGQTVILSQTPLVDSDPAKIGMRLYLIRADAVK